MIGGSLVIAELLFKFHSFTLECLAFLGTRFALDAAASLVRAALGPVRGADARRWSPHRRLEPEHPAALPDLSRRGSGLLGTTEC